MVKGNRRFLDMIKAHILTIKNADAPLNKHYDLSLGDYTDNPTQEGYHWSNDTYRMEPD